MRKAEIEALHPDDREFATRRESLRKGMKVVEGVGLLGAFGVLGGSIYEASQQSKKFEELNKTHPKPKEGDPEVAARLLERKNTHNDIPEGLVKWSRQQIDQQKVHDEKVAQTFPKGSMPFTKKYGTPLTVTSGVVAVSGLIAEYRVEGKTERELTRRDLLRRVAGRAIGNDTK